MSKKVIISGLNIDWFKSVLLLIGILLKSHVVLLSLFTWHYPVHVTPPCVTVESVPFEVYLYSEKIRGCVTENVSKLLSFRHTIFNTASALCRSIKCHHRVYSSKSRCLYNFYIINFFMLSFSNLCINSDKINSVCNLTNMYIYIYIYIYVCVCV